MSTKKSADTSFRDLVARLNAMSNITPEEESSDMSEALTPEQFSQSVPTARGEKALRKAEDETVKQIKVGSANGETYSEKIYQENR